jgi:hypothetical protein
MTPVLTRRLAIGLWSHIAPMGSRGGIVVNVVIGERTPKALLRLGFPQEHPSGEPGSDGADTQSNGTHAGERSGHIS